MHFSIAILAAIALSGVILLLLAIYEKESDEASRNFTPTLPNRRRGAENEYLRPPQGPSL